MNFTNVNTNDCKKSYEPLSIYCTVFECPGKCCNLYGSLHHDPASSQTNLAAKKMNVLIKIA